MNETFDVLKKYLYILFDYKENKITGDLEYYISINNGGWTQVPEEEYIKLYEEFRRY